MQMQIKKLIEQLEQFAPEELLYCFQNGVFSELVVFEVLRESEVVVEECCSGGIHYYKVNYYSDHGSQYIDTQPQPEALTQQALLAYAKKQLRLAQEQASEIR